LKTRRDQAKKATVIPPRVTEEAEKMMRKLRVKQILSNITGHSLNPCYDASTSGIKCVDFLCTVLTTMQHKHKNIKMLHSFPHAYVVACALSCVVVRTQ
jgi:hypothetical protein